MISIGLLGIALGLTGASWLRLKELSLQTQAEFVLPLVLGASLVSFVMPRYGMIAFAGAIACSAALAVMGKWRPAGLTTRVGCLMASLTLVPIALAARDAFAAPGEAWLFSLLGAATNVTGILIAGRAAVQRTFDRRVVGWYFALFVGFALLAGLAQGSAVLPCRTEFGKCGAAGVLVVGAFSSENALGYFAAVALLFIGATELRRGTSRFSTSSSMGLLLLVIVLTGSRTATLGLLTALSVGAILRRLGTASGRTRVSVAIAASVVSSGIGLWLVRSAVGADLSNRGFLWQEIQDRTPLLSAAGMGRSAYVDLLESGAFRGHYPHSQYLYLAAFGGLVALALYVVALYCLLRTCVADRRTFISVTALPVFLGAYGLLEIAWNPLGVDPNLAVMLGVVMVCASSSGSVGRRVVSTARPTRDSVRVLR